MKKMLPVVLILLIIISGLAGCAPREAEEPQHVITIGVVGPMAYVQGQMMWWGAQMARDEINEAGGFKVGDQTYTVELIQVDTNEIAADPADAVMAVDNVVDKCDFFVGGFRTEAVFPYTELVVKDNKKIFMICGAADNELLQGRVDKDYETWKYLFRVTPLKSTDLGKVAVLMTSEVAMNVREALGIAKPKVVVMAENLEWAEPMVVKMPEICEMLGLELVEVCRPSATAQDLTPELRIVESSGAHIIFTVLSGPVGIPYGKQWGQLKIPACSVGINVEAQKDGYMVATDGYGDYDFTMHTYAPNARISEVTIPWLEKFVELYGEFPNYNAGTYEAIYKIIEAAGRADSLDYDALVVELERTERINASGLFKFDELHDVIWGPGFITAVGMQWQEGQMKCAWPHKWKPDPVNHPDYIFGYEGSVPYQIPPHVKEQWGIQ